MSWQQQQAQWQSQGAGGPQGAHAGGHAQPHAPYGAAPFQPAGNGAGAPQDMSFMSFDLSGAAGQGGGVGPGGAGGSVGQAGSGAGMAAASGRMVQGGGGAGGGGGGFGAAAATSGFGAGMTTGRMGRQPSYASFDDEPPLLEELGINLPQIWRKTTQVLLPMRVSAAVLEDGDLCGPIAFLLAFGSLLLLAGKMYFGVLYGWSVVGTMAVYSVLSLLAGKGDAVDFYTCTSLVGYCMLPLLAPAALALLIPHGAVLNTVALGAATWGAGVGSSHFCTIVKPFAGQRALVAAPLALLYAAFTTLIVF